MGRKGGSERLPDLPKVNTAYRRQIWEVSPARLTTEPIFPAIPLSFLSGRQECAVRGQRVGQQALPFNFQEKKLITVGNMKGRSEIHEPSYINEN